MKTLRPISRSRHAALRLVSCVILAAAGPAMAQVSLAPPVAITPQASKPPPPAKPKPKPTAPAKDAARKPTPKPDATPAPTATVVPTPVPDDPNVDLVYAAFQLGLYKTCFDAATKRVQEKGDPKAMTMLGELYANGFGVKRDNAKAIEWYRRASDAEIGRAHV